MPRSKREAGKLGHYQYFGTFSDAREAALVYDAAAMEHFGEFAMLNFPDQTGEPSA